MSEFIVLGLIPGTQMQITFVAWMIIAAALAVGIVVRSGYRARLFQAWVIASSISRETRRQS